MLLNKFKSYLCANLIQLLGWILYVYAVQQYHTALSWVWFQQNKVEDDFSFDNSNFTESLIGQIVDDGFLKLNVLCKFTILGFHSHKYVVQKSGWWNSNFGTSECQNHLQTKYNLHISICQSQVLCVKT